MKIKDFRHFRAFRDAVFVDYRTYEPILDQEKEIEDIYCIQTAGEVEYVGKGMKYAAIHHHLTVQLVIKEK